MSSTNETPEVNSKSTSSQQFAPPLASNSSSSTATASMTPQKRGLSKANSTAHKPARKRPVYEIDNPIMQIPASDGSIYEQREAEGGPSFETSSQETKSFSTRKSNVKGITSTKSKARRIEFSDLCFHTDVSIKYENGEIGVFKCDECGLYKRERVEILIPLDQVSDSSSTSATSSTSTPVDAQPVTELTQSEQQSFSTVVSTSPESDRVTISEPELEHISKPNKKGHNIHWPSCSLATFSPCKPSPPQETKEQIFKEALSQLPNLGNLQASTIGNLASNLLNPYREILLDAGLTAIRLKSQEEEGFLLSNIVAGTKTPFNVDGNNKNTMEKTPLLATPETEPEIRTCSEKEIYAALLKCLDKHIKNLLLCSSCNDIHTQETQKQQPLKSCLTQIPLSSSSSATAKLFNEAPIFQIFQFAMKNFVQEREREFHLLMRGYESDPNEWPNGKKYKWGSSGFFCKVLGFFFLFRLLRGKEAE